MALPVSRDPALEAHLFWHKYKTAIFSVIVIILLGIIGFAGYRLFSERRDAAGAALLAAAKSRRIMNKSSPNIRARPLPHPPIFSWLRRNETIVSSRKQTSLFRLSSTKIQIMSW